jgi:hypothetical protein
VPVSGDVPGLISGLTSVPGMPAVVLAGLLGRGEKSGRVWIKCRAGAHLWGAAAGVAAAWCWRREGPVLVPGGG